MRSMAFAVVVLLGTLVWPVSSEAQDVEYALRLTDLGGAELPQDMHGNYVGLPGVRYNAEVWVDDLRSVGASGGVYAGYIDLVYDKDLVDWIGGSIVYDPDDPGFKNGLSGTVDEPNRLLDELGAFQSSFTPPGADPAQYLCRVTFEVKAGLTELDTVLFSLDAADLSPAHDTLVYGSNDPVSAISFGSAPLVVPEPGSMLLLGVASLGLLSRWGRSRRSRPE